MAGVIYAELQLINIAGLGQVGHGARFHNDIAIGILTGNVVIASEPCHALANLLAHSGNMATHAGGLVGRLSMNVSQHGIELGGSLNSVTLSKMPCFMPRSN